MQSTKGFLALCLSTTAICSPAFAAPAGELAKEAPEASAQSASNDEGEIIVTAQRREERLIDVPIAVSAVGAAALERAGVQNLNNIQSIIPNFQINQTPGNSFSPLISLRGIAPSGDTSLARDQPVGLYLDGVPVAKSTGAAFDTVDLERVEVLRGPQGTLYGKNTIGGAVNMITRKPSGEWGGQAWLSYGSWNLIQRRVSVNLPEVGNIKIKLGYSGKSQDGYWRNAATKGYFGEQKLNAGRADVLWEPSSSFSARYVYDISDAKGTPTLLALSAIGATFPSSLRSFVAGREAVERPGRDGVSAQSALQSDFKTTGHSLTLALDLGTGFWGNAEVRSITARRTMESRSQSDFDGTPTDLIRFILNNDYNAFSQELQLVGGGESLKYTFGAFYLDDEYYSFNPRWNFQFGNNTRNDLSDRGGGSKSVAGYGQVTWTPDFADRALDLSVGVRYTHDKKSAYELFLGNSAYAANSASVGSGVFQRLSNGTPVTRSGQPAAGARPGAGGIGPYDLLPLQREDSWSKFNPEFNFVYRIQPDWSVYGRIATGFKSGGINDTASNNAAFNKPYNPENLLSFEAGTKYVSPNRALNLGLSAYHSIYKNFQAGVFVPELVTTNIINAGEAQFTGVEAEGTIRPFSGLSLNFGAGYLDARYTDFILPSGENVTATYKIPLSPEWNYLLGSAYKVPLPGMTFEASTNWSWRSMQWGTIAPNLLAKRKAYGTLDARVGLTDIKITGGISFDVALWGRNLTDTSYWNSAIDLGILALRQWADPRSMGAEARFRF